MFCLYKQFLPRAQLHQDRMNHSICDFFRNHQIHKPWLTILMHMGECTLEHVLVVGSNEANARPSWTGMYTQVVYVAIPFTTLTCTYCHQYASSNHVDVVVWVTYACNCMVFLYTSPTIIVQLYVRFRKSKGWVILKNIDKPHGPLP